MNQSRHWEVAFIFVNVSLRTCPHYYISHAGRTSIRQRKYLRRVGKRFAGGLALDVLQSSLRLALFEVTNFPAGKDTFLLKHLQWGPTLRLVWLFIQIAFQLSVIKPKPKLITSSQSQRQGKKTQVANQNTNKHQANGIKRYYYDSCRTRALNWVPTFNHWCRWAQAC